MTRRLLILRPHDVAVALQLVLFPYSPLAVLARDVRLSLGEVHNAEQRLKAARLIRRNHRYPNHRGLLEFIIHGVPYAYPAAPGPVEQGVPTARSAPALRRHVRAVPGLVWPTEKGSMRGAAVIPLYPRAVELQGHNRDLYDWLTLVDALRVGHGEERTLARSVLEAEVSGRVAQV